MNKKKKRKQFEDSFWATLFAVDVPAHLNELTSHLEKIRMRLWDKVTDDHLELLITGVTSVNMLDLDETDITEEGIAHLTKMDFIRELRLKGIRELDNDCIVLLSKIKGLELLHLRGTSINLDGALKLEGQGNLKRLLISDVEDFPDTERVNQLRKMMPNCEITINRETYPPLDELLD